MERLRRGNLRVDEIYKSKKRLKKRLMILIVLVILLFLSVFVLMKLKNVTYNDFQVTNSTELSNLSNSNFVPYRNGILKANHDGAEAISAEGKQIWNVPYNMKNPIMDVCLSYAVIGDLGGKTAYIVNGSGVSNEIHTLYPIVDVQVAAQGVAALILNNGTKDLVNIYSMEQSSEIVYVESISAKDGFPISIALSEDGSKLITSYVKADTDSISCQVTFHNFGNIGKNYKDNLVSSQLFSKFVPKVEFIMNDIAAVFLEDGFWLYSMEEKPSELAKIEFKNRIKDVFYSQDYIGVVLDTQGTKQSNQLLVYNLKGKKLVEKELTFSYDSITAGETFIVFYNKDICYVMNKEGKKLFEDSFQLTINKLLPGPSNKEFLIINDLGVDLIEMVETKEE